jgi:TRAP transporter TAXI family solute receptor
MSTIPRLRRSRRLLWAVAAILSITTLALSVWLVGTPPPRKIVLATGDPDGAFAALGREYKARLDRMGLQIDLVETHGSIDNLRRVQAGEADAAFVQAGSARSLDDAGDLCSLAAVGSEPLWLFARPDIPATSLRDLQGLRISVGPTDSGSDTLGRLLLDAHGVIPANTVLSNRPMGQLPQALADNTIDAGLIVCSPEAPLIRDLLGNRHVRLVSPDCQSAMSRRFPYLRPVVLPAGVVDLKRKVPAADVPLLAPSIVLVAREDLHPRAVEQLLLTARIVHGPGNMLDEAGRFPSTEGTDLPLHVAAERFAQSGESFTSRVLSYRAARLVWQLQLLALPLLALLVPFWKTLPLLYSLRINRILKRHYAALREAENRLDHCDDAVELRRCLDTLDAMRTDLEHLSRKLPAHLQRDVYHWRLHVALVRTEGVERLRRLEQNTPVAPEIARPAVRVEERCGPIASSNGATSP